VMAINSFARPPDLTLFIDASIDVCYARMGERGGQRQLFETRLTDTRAKYMQVIAFVRARGEAVELVDANGSPEQTLSSALATLAARAPDWLRTAAQGRI
jgi:thymidylate kinase